MINLYVVILITQLICRLHCENVGWMTYKLESRLLGEMSATSGTSLMAENEEDLKSLLMRVKKESEKIWLKTPQEKN